MYEYSDDPILGLAKSLERDNSMYEDIELTLIANTFDGLSKHLIIPEDVPNFRNDVKRVYFEVANSRPNQQLDIPPSISEIIEIIDEENFNFIDIDLNSINEQEAIIEEVKLEYLKRYSRILPDRVKTQLINMGLIFTEKQIFEGDIFHQKIGLDQIIINPKILYSDAREYLKYEREKIRSIGDR